MLPMLTVSKRRNAHNAETEKELQELNRIQIMGSS